MEREQQSCLLCAVQVKTRNVRKSHFTFYKSQWETDDDNSETMGKWNICYGGYGEGGGLKRKEVHKKTELCKKVRS